MRLWRVMILYWVLLGGALLLAVRVTDKADKQWSTFLIDHQCRKISASKITGTQGWKCNDGETYWRSAYIGRSLACDLIDHLNTLFDLGYRRKP